ncbi:MAG TPA: phytanoyl-CoA dioxygenase family protein [Acidimicrobiia bacterium]
MSVDLRSRTDGAREPIDAERFFTDTLPTALAANIDGIGPGARWLELRPLTLEVDGVPWALSWDGNQVTVDAGTAEHGAHARITREQLDDLVSDQQTIMGFWTSGRLEQPTGRLGDLLDWWLVLRAALDHQPIHTPGGISFVDRDGGPLDLGRSFRSDDDPAELRHFLEQTGFLHLEGVFTEEEMAQVSREMDAAAPRYSLGDGNSWWAKTGDGDDRLVRMQAFDDESPATAELVRDPRFLSLADIPADGHEWGKRPRNRIEALFKPIGIVQGISDVPWHKDCSLGRHSYECCSLTVGISVTGADAVSGQLRVRPGSHRALVWPAMEQPNCDLPTVDLPTCTGDVTIHLSCTLHMAQPPVERERRVMYSGFALPAFDPAAAAEARARLVAVREAAPVTVSQPPGHTG